MERSHTPLGVWFWAAYLVASQTPGMSAVQFQRQLGLTRYETAFGILHKLRAGMVRPDQDRIGGRPKEHVEVDETWVGGRTRGEGRGIHHKTLVAAAVEVRHRKPGTAQDKRKDGRYAGRVRLAIAADRGADSLCGFVENAVMPGSLIVTDDWSGYASLRKRGFDHHAIAECGEPEVAEQFMPMVHLVFSNLKTWLNGIHHGVSAKHLQADFYGVVADRVRTPHELPPRFRTMYFRKKTSGGRASLQIVESRREGASVRQQVIATLGRVEDLREGGQLERLLRSGARPASISKAPAAAFPKTIGRTSTR